MEQKDILVPHEYKCGITGEIITDPVIIADGYTYQRESVTEWFARGNNRSPTDGTILRNKVVIDNNIAKKTLTPFLFKLTDEIPLKSDRSHLEKCIQQKEEMIKYMIENNQLDINKTSSASIDVVQDLKKKNAELKEQIIQNEEIRSHLQKELQNKISISDLQKHNFKKCCSYKFDNLFSIFELREGLISCWTDENVDLLEFRNNKNLELTKSFPLKTDIYLVPPVQQKSGNIIYIYWNEIIICDKSFKVIGNFKESTFISSLSRIYKDCFVVGLRDGTLKLYEFKSKTERHVIAEFKFYSDGLYSLLYMAEHNYLVLGSIANNIIIFNLWKNEPVKKLSGHNNSVFSLVYLDDNTFASASKAEIKIWYNSANLDFNIECIKTIFAHESTNCFIYLSNLGPDLIVSKSKDEFKIWNWKTYECLKSYKEDSFIQRLIVTKNNKIITATKDSIVNIWHI